MIHLLLLFLVIILAWGATGAFGWLFCITIIWREFDFSILDEEDYRMLALMTCVGVVSWFIVLELVLEDIRKGNPIGFKLPKFKSKSQRFLEKLES